MGDGCDAAQGVVDTGLIVIIAEMLVLAFEIARTPERHLVKQLTTNGANKPFDEWRLGRS